MMSGAAPLTEAEVRELADEWYNKLDEHAPPEEFVSLLASEGLEMNWPEGPFYGFDGFKRWYDRVLVTFFNEVHSIKEFSVTPEGDRAGVKVTVQWQANTWKPPAPFSERVFWQAYQTWAVKRDPATGKPVIQTLTVDSYNIL
jgi:hypothetical protein